MKEIWKHISTQCMALFLSMLTIYNMLPQHLQDTFSTGELKTIAYILIGLGLLGKFIRQPNVKGKQDENSNYD